MSYDVTISLNTSECNLLMAGNYYELNACKDLLNIEIDDTVEDELLNRFGRVANSHLANILKAHDE